MVRKDGCFPTKAISQLPSYGGCCGRTYDTDACSFPRYQNLSVVFEMESAQGVLNLTDFKMNTIIEPETPFSWAVLIILFSNLGKSESSVGCGYTLTFLFGVGWVSLPAFLVSFKTACRPSEQTAQAASQLNRKRHPPNPKEQFTGLSVIDNRSYFTI